MTQLIDPRYPMLQADLPSTTHTIDPFERLSQATVLQALIDLMVLCNRPHAGKRKDWTKGTIEAEKDTIKEFLLGDSPFIEYLGRDPERMQSVIDQIEAGTATSSRHARTLLREMS